MLHLLVSQHGAPTREDAFTRLTPKRLSRNQLKPTLVIRIWMQETEMFQPLPVQSKPGLTERASEG
jgi:hypothetical protein